MIGMFWLYLTFLLGSVKLSEAAAVSDCSEEEPHYRYLVYPGDIVYFQCNLPSNELASTGKNAIHWFKQKPNGSFKEVEFGKDLSVGRNGSALHIVQPKQKHSGTYICRSKHLCRKIIVQVKEMENCFKHAPKSLLFRTTDKGSTMSCPSLSCHQEKNITNVMWLKTENLEPVISPLRPSINLNKNDIQFSNIFVPHSGIYTCDHVLYMNGNRWIIRATIKLSVDVPDTRKPPIIMGPFNGTEIKAELGKPFKLQCRIKYGYERNFKPLFKWTILHPEGNEEHFGIPDFCSGSGKSSGLEGYDCTVTITLEQVTEKDLRKIYQCSAQNSQGNVTTIVRLSKKEPDLVIRTYILCASILVLLIILMAAGTVYIYWVEIVLLYRHYLSKDETIGDNKDFDAFISYATGFSEETTGNSYENYEDEQFATHLLPSVLEDTYHYKLCILERDILPGGAYVEDIAKIIRRSRRAIFILSQRYITGPSLFELQAAITCSLEEQERLKLILIKLKPFKEPETLPHIVKKALRALPTVSWKGDTNSKSQASKFWRRIRYYMPVKKSRQM
ncbi:interleukin-18 receptor accessory protein [Engystomops pustulosus]|uniref:interleukin-18 receptor accessory protein n=1 Tax=Engystomops pustulosus TaxID=76066 RepID=UPI003AFB5FEA